MLKESHFEYFKTELYKLLTSRQGVHTLNTSIDAILMGCDAYDKKVDEELAQTGDQLSKASQLLGEIQQYNRQNVAVVIEALNKVKAKLTDTIATGCGQMERLFFQMFQQAINALQEKPGITSYEVQKAISEVSYKCYTMANNEWNPKMKAIVIKEYKVCIDNLLEQRRKAVANKLKTLKREYPGTSAESSLYSIDQDDVFNSFGFPSFSYQMPVMPPQKTAVPANYRPTALNSVKVSLQTLEKHWGIYCDTVVKWWTKTFINDAEASSKDIDKIFQEIENRKKDREFQQIQIDGQRKNIRDIRSRVESIRLKIRT